MLRDIVEKEIPMKPYFSAEATSLLKVLLERDPAKRIGYSERDAEELMEHPFFKSINWDDVAHMKHATAYKPKVKGAEDISCIDKLFTKEGLEETYVDPNALSGNQKQATNF
jgi:serine/threonine protein kinase